MTKVLVMLLLICSILLGSPKDSCELENMEADYRIATSSDQVTMPRSELAAIYAGRINNWDDGTRIYIYVRPYNDYTQQHMAINLLGMSPGVFHQYTKTNPRIKILPKSRIINAIEAKVGALGIVDENTVYLHAGNTIRMLRITND